LFLFSAKIWRGWIAEEQSQATKLVSPALTNWDSTVAGAGVLKTINALRRKLS
jgi:hypothetical protein